MINYAEQLQNNDGATLPEAKFSYLLAIICAISFLLACEARGETPARPSLNGDSVVLNQNDIQALNVRSIVELLNRLPGVSASNTSVSLQGSSSKHVLVLLDGRPLNNPVTGQIDFGALSTDRVTELRVLKGSGAVQYGDNSSGGVILITTRDSGSGSRNVELQYGSYNSTVLSADISSSINATDLAFNANRKNSDGYRPNNDSTELGAALSLSRVFSPQLDGRLALAFGNIEKGYAGKVSRPTPRARNYVNSRSALLNMKYRQVESRTYYNIFKNNYKDPDRNISNSLNTTILGQELRFSGPFSAGLKLEEQIADSTNFGVQREDQQSSFIFNRFSLFGATDKAVTAGLRVNRHSQFGMSYNPQLGFIFESSPFGIAIELNRSSNTPTFKQRFNESTFARANPDLGMETATNAKANLSYTVNDTATLNLSVFYNKTDNTIAYIGNIDGTYSYQNIDSSTRRGVDTSIDWQITSNFKLNASYLFLQVTDDASGLYLPRKPKHKAKLNLDATFGSILLSITGQWVSNSFDDKANTQTQAGYFIADSNASYSYGNTQFLFSIKNMFDEYYEYHRGIPAAGITFMAGVNHRF